MVPHCQIWKRTKCAVGLCPLGILEVKTECDFQSVFYPENPRFLSSSNYTAEWEIPNSQTSWYGTCQGYFFFSIVSFEDARAKAKRRSPSPTGVLRDFGKRLVLIETWTSFPGPLSTVDASLEAETFCDKTCLKPTAKRQKIKLEKLRTDWTDQERSSLSFSFSPPGVSSFQTEGCEIIFSLPFPFIDRLSIAFLFTMF